MLDHKELINLLEKNLDEIVDIWMSKENVISILESYNIDITFFKQNFAKGIVQYIVDVLYGYVEVGNCPVMEEFMKLVATKDLYSRDIFTICSNVAESINQVMVKTNNLHYIPFIFNMFQQNFVGILDIYDKAHRANNENFIKYKNIISQSNLLSFTDTKGIITDVNDNFVKISGYTREELIGKPHNIVRHPDMPSSAFLGLWQTIKQQKIWKGLIKNRKKDGGFYWVLATIIPMLDRYGNTESYAAIRIDVTKLKELEEQNKILHENEIKKAGEINKLKDSFLSTTTHELRTPLTAIKGYLSMLENGVIGKIDDEAKGYITDLLHNVDDLIKFINNFLDIKKIEAGQMVIKESEFKISDLLERTYNHMLILAKEKEQDLILVDNSNNVVIKSDYTRIKQVLINLISNAIKYTPQKGLIKIMTCIENNKLKIKIIDTGYGMSEDELECLFDEFSQFENESKEHGNGIGMFVVKSIIDQLNGNISVESEKGKGTTFTISFNIKK